jgi:tetratricopeptide (TPR) repeat protein
LYMLQKKYPEAVRPLEEAFELDPNLPSCRENLLFLYEQLQMEAKRQELLRTKQTPPPPSARRLCYLGMQAQLTGNFQSALEYYQQALRLNPQLIEAKRSLALLYIILHHERDGLSLLAELTSLADLDAETYSVIGRIFWLMKQHQQSLAAYVKAIELNPDHLEAQQMIGRNYLALQQSEKAIVPLQRAIQIAPANATAYQDLVQAYGNLKQNEALIRTLQQLAMLAPDDANTFQVLGYLLIGNKRFEEGITALQRVLQLQPNNKDVQDTLQSAIMAMNSRPNLEALQQDVARNPNNAKAHFLLGNAYEYYGKEVEALAAYREAHRLAPEHQEAVREYAFALRRAGKPEEGLAVFHKYYDAKPASFEKYFYLGNIASDAKRFEEAIEHLTKALALKKDAHFTAWILALAYEEQNQSVEAIATLEHLLKYNPDFSQAIFELGALYRQAGQIQRARQMYERLLKIHPSLAESLRVKIEQ